MHGFMENRFFQIIGADPAVDILRIDGEKTPGVLGKGSFVTFQQDHMRQGFAHHGWQMAHRGCDPPGIVGGGIANTFVAAQGHNVGKSLYEADLVDEAKRLLTTCDIPVPTDVRVATEFSETATATLKSVNDIKDEEQILDLGDASAEKLAEILKNAKTILWNGPVGVFEFPNFRKGTEIVANAIADSEAFSIAGGGDTLSAIDLFGISDKISYISTGGGAFLEFVEGKVLPAVAMLEERAKQ